MEFNTPNKEVRTLRGDFGYFGDQGDWLMGISQHRDSALLDRSNFEVISKDMQTRFPEDTAIERFGHFAVGWTEHLLINPQNADAVSAITAWRNKLEDYPIADEDAFSELEWSEHGEHVESGVPYTDDCSLCSEYAYEHQRGDHISEPNENCPCCHSEQMDSED